MLLILIDGDILVWRAACAVEKRHWEVHLETGEEIPCSSKKEAEECLEDRGFRGGLQQVTEAESVSHALQIIKSMIKNIVQAIEDHYVDDQWETRIYLSSDDKSNFRYAAAKTVPYKSTRPDYKPTHYSAVREYLINWGAEVVYVEEADDAIGKVATGDYSEEVEVIIVSTDKDLNMIPGTHYNFVKKKFYSISEFTAMKNFYLQMLTGDTTDTIPGLYGIGTKKAAKILQEFDHDNQEEGSIEEMEALCHMHNKVVRTYFDHGKDMDYFYEMEQLLWIRRWNDDKDIWDGEFEIECQKQP